MALPFRPLRAHPLPCSPLSKLPRALFTVDRARECARGTDDSSSDEGPVLSKRKKEMQGSENNLLLKKRKRDDEGDSKVSWRLSTPARLGLRACEPEVEHTHVP